MSGIMRETHRRTVLAGGWTLLLAGLARKCVPDARAQSGRQTGEQTGGQAPHPPVQPFSIVKPHAPSILPPIRFQRADGTETTLASYRGRGVVLNLWATWCVPCVAELPSLDALARALAVKGIVVLPVSIDHDGAARVPAFFKAHGIASLPVLLDPHGAILQAIGQEGIPMTLLIGPDGREVARVQGSVNWADPAAAETVARLVG
ncbi:TlpA family protein disulfide reductase [Acetobacteraceae bacterium KSS8]|uniref:TlpA family protein disulfide reductase n=1 Tax=Endosaccharibacter trunci TaxID=2812733 RepID=A0ABT1W2R8_9PROT|nr:TlpA family protein disulfide reductase [Acetobacteraceae bacterium KSS8]